MLYVWTDHSNCNLSVASVLDLFLNLGHSVAKDGQAGINKGCGHIPMLTCFRWSKMVQCGPTWYKVVEMVQDGLKRFNVV